MSKKDYQLIADVFGAKIGELRRQQADAETFEASFDAQGKLIALRDVIYAMAEELKRDNPKFRYDKFFPVCGLNEFGELEEV